MKTIFYCLLLGGVMFSGLYLALNSDGVRASEYHSCMVTSTNKAVCQVFRGEPDVTITLADGVAEDDITISNPKNLYVDIK